MFEARSIPGAQRSETEKSGLDFNPMSQLDAISETLVFWSKSSLTDFISRGLLMQSFWEYSTSKRLNSMPSGIFKRTSNNYGRVKLRTAECTVPYCVL